MEHTWPGGEQGRQFIDISFAGNYNIGNKKLRQGELWNFVS